MNAGRNAPCPCGSGRKYKACCGRLPRHIQAATREAGEEALSVELGRLVALMDGASYAALESAARELLGLHPQLGYAWQMLGVALTNQGKDARHAWARAHNACRMTP